jgi:acyl carrier protein
MKFIEIVSKILLIDQAKIVDDLSREDFEEWDSMAHLVLVSDIEQEFDIIFSDDEVTSIITISDLKNSLKNHGIVI